LKAALPNVVVGHHDRNLGAQHDFGLSRPGDVTFGAVEVTAAADSAYVESWMIIDSNMPWRDSRLVGGWKVYARPGRKARKIKALQKELPALLQALERAGQTALHRKRHQVILCNRPRERWESRGPTKRRPVPCGLKACGAPELRTTQMMRNPWPGRAGSSTGMMSNAGAGRTLPYTV
jgi:hypothetical protein